MDKITQPTILVIVGISGDLAKRKLLPAISEIAAAGIAPEHFKIVGISRRGLAIDDVLPEGEHAYLRSSLELYQMDLSNGAEYEALAARLQEVEREFGTKTQRLFYLSVPPQVSHPIIQFLGETGLTADKDTKLLLEKPFGTDLESAESLIGHIKQYFSEEQIYRIDHYLAKEMAQNLIAFRSSNPLFAHTWSNAFIEKIDVIASEKIDIEGRAGFYEQTGALRDLVQSHLLQLAALVLMETPTSETAIPELRLKALQDLLPPTDIAASVFRAQYKSYRSQVENPGSNVETFVSLTLGSRDERWQGVPITITTGKALEQKLTEIRLTYRQKGCPQTNQLILRIQPNEGIEVKLWVKEPGYSNKLQQLPLDFMYKQHFAGLPEAYERVFVDAMRSDHSLFATSEEVLASWQILQPILHTWSMGTSDLAHYEDGSKFEDVIQTD